LNALDKAQDVLNLFEEGGRAQGGIMRFREAVLKGCEGTDQFEPGYVPPKLDCQEDHKEDPQPEPVEPVEEEELEEAA